jgi:hypothetical protein
MASTRELLEQIKLRAWALVIQSNGDIDYRTAERAAAKEVAEQERQRKRSLAVQSCTAPSPEGVTVSNARKFLYDRLAEIASRLALSAHLVDEPTPEIRKHVEDPQGTNPDVPAPSVTLPPSREPEEPPPDQITGGFIFGTVSTHERIPDEQFHTSVRSPTTEAWRRSIEHNERAEARKRGRFIG